MIQLVLRPERNDVETIKQREKEEKSQQLNKIIIHGECLWSRSVGEVAT
jgi:hypothetical protein